MGEEQGRQEAELAARDFQDGAMAAFDIMLGLVMHEVMQKPASATWILEGLRAAIRDARQKNDQSSKIDVLSHHLRILEQAYPDAA